MNYSCICDNDDLIFYTHADVSFCEDGPHKTENGIGPIMN